MDGFSQGTPQVMDASNANPHFQHTNSGAMDHGELGQYYASHGERQQAILNPDQGVAVDRPMCQGCRERFFPAHARNQGKIQVVADPDGARIFYPDGRVKFIPRDLIRDWD